MSLFSNEQREMTIQEGCPWYEAQQAYGAPNVNWCEPTICSFINEPANTWSNLGFILVAVALILKFKKSFLKMFAVNVFFMGLFSGVYHASNNYLVQIVDFVGMGMVGSFMLAFSFRRLEIKRFESFQSLYWMFLFFYTLLLLLFDIVNLPIQFVTGLYVVGFIAVEFFVGFKNSQLRRYNYFFIGTVLILLAQSAAQIDLKGIYCKPENIILHGHALWHLLCSVSVLAMAFHLNRFKDTKNSLSG